MSVSWVHCVWIRSESQCKLMKIWLKLGSAEHQLSMFSPWRWRLGESQVGIPLGRETVSHGQGHAAALKLCIGSWSYKAGGHVWKCPLLPWQVRNTAKSMVAALLPTRCENLLSSWLLSVSLFKDHVCIMKSLLLKLWWFSHWRWAFCLCGYKKLKWQKSS